MRRSPKKFCTNLLLCALTALALFLYLRGGANVSCSPVALSELTQNVGDLQTMERESPPSLSELRPTPTLAPTPFKTPEPSAAPEIAGTPASSDEPELPVWDDAAERERILAMEQGDRAELRKRLKRVAIVGDSIVHAAQEYGWLTYDNIFAKIGVRVASAKSIRSQIVAAKPKDVILCFGMNDVETYIEKVDRFIQDYEKYIAALRDALPDARIFVHPIFPVTEATCNKKTFYQYIDLYNQELLALCERMEVPVIDGTFLLTQQSWLYDKDGIHPKTTFYGKWLTYLADYLEFEGH